MTDRQHNAPPAIQDGLLPCPFCGSPPAYAHEDDVWHLVRCTNRKCETQCGSFPTKPMAFRAWNTRAAPTATGGDETGARFNDPGCCRGLAPEDQCECAEFGKEKRAATGSARDPKLAALRPDLATPAAEGREALDEDQVMALMKKCFGAKTVRYLSHTVWKDGIDIDRVSASTMDFANACAALRSPMDVRCGVQAASALKLLADLFSESAHETWTKDEIVNIIEDAIRLGSSRVPSANPLPADPAPARWPAKGDMMTFLGKNGYEFELEAALKIFTPGERYRVHDCMVEAWSHSVQFDGVKGWFNGVMFDFASPISSTTSGSGQ